MEKEQKEKTEDKSIYGEMVPSLFNWITPDKQKERARRHMKISETSNKKD